MRKGEQKGAKYHGKTNKCFSTGLSGHTPSHRGSLGKAPDFHGSLCFVDLQARGPNDY